MEELFEEVKLIDAETDVFNTYSKAKAISDFFNLDENRTLLEKNNLIAIYGKWGCGKSCLMKTVENSLDKNKYITSWFDTWKYEKDENLPYSLLKYIGKDSFKNKLEQIGENFKANAYGILSSIASGIEFNIGIGTTGMTIMPGEMLGKVEAKIKELEEKKANEKCLWEKIEEFEEDYKKIQIKDNKKLVVFLDDLDRCESENIIKLISSIKLLLSINKNIIFVIGIDKSAVTLALQNKYNNDQNKSEEYLEKIFPISFEISDNVESPNFLQYISNYTGLNIEDSKMIVDFFDKIQFKNARHIKKVLRKYYFSKNYLSSNGIDISNKHQVLLVIYMIILNLFYNDEYHATMIEDKEKVYRDIILYDVFSGVKKTYDFSIKPKKINFEHPRIKAFEVYNLLLRFSSYKIKKTEVKISFLSDTNAKIEYNNWMEIFESNICKDFIEFIIKDVSILHQFFLKDSKIDGQEIYKILKIIDGIL